MLYQSDPITIANGLNSVSINDILLVVPDKITWTFGVTTSDALNAGVIFSGTADPGTSLDDFWLKTSGGWELNRGGGFTDASSTNNFRAKVFAYNHGSISFVYTPDLDFSGTDSLTYKILDGRGGEATATATFDVQTSFYGLDGDNDGLPDGEEAFGELIQRSLILMVMVSLMVMRSLGDQIQWTRLSKPFFSEGSSSDMPSLTQEPTSQRVLSGASAAFTVRATPATSWKYTCLPLAKRWFRYEHGPAKAANFRNDNGKF